MSRKKSFVGELSNTEVVTLEQGHKYGRSPDLRLRCQMLLLSGRGYEAKQIAAIADVCPQTVYATLSQWEQQGLAGIIRRKGQGRKPVLQLSNKAHVEAVSKAVEQRAQSSVGILEQVSAQLELGPMSKRSLRRFFKKVVTVGSASAGG